jgi:hypothetical protein
VVESEDVENATVASLRTRRDPAVDVFGSSLSLQATVAVLRRFTATALAVHAHGIVAIASRIRRCVTWGTDARSSNSTSAVDRGSLVGRRTVSRCAAYWWVRSTFDRPHRPRSDERPKPQEIPS